MRDQHFAVLSFYLKKLEFKKRITNIYEILDCFNSSQHESNIIRLSNKLKPINSVALIIPAEKRIKTDFLNIVQLESLYNIQNVRKANGFSMATTVLSDLKHLLSLNGLESAGNTTKKNINKFTQLSEPKVDFPGLKKKHENIKKDLERIKRINQTSSDEENSEDESDSEDDPDETLNDFVPNDEDIPKLCRIKNNKRHEGSCNKHCNFSINEIKNLDQRRLADELYNHGHPKSLKKNKNQLYNTNERRGVNSTL